jgi:hypothetical protein
MIRTAIAAASLVVLSLALAAGTTASEAAARKAPVKAAASPASTAPVERVQDCSEFYDPYRSRGFGWGSGPPSNVGFGMFEGALPAYPMNSFPNWYGLCETWGHYSATGSAPR